MVAGNSARMRLIAAGMLLLTGAFAQTGAAGMSYMHGMWIAWFGLFGYLYSLVLCVYERSLSASALSSIYESGHFDVKPDADKASMYRRAAMAASDFSRAADESWEIFLAGSKSLFKQMPTILLPGYPLWVIGWSDKTP